MPIGGSAKILAKLIQAYRAAWLATTEVTMGGTNIRQAIMKAILGGKSLQPKANFFTGKKPEDIANIMKFLRPK